MSIRGAGGRSRAAGKHPGSDPPNGGAILASGFPAPGTKRRMKRPTITNLRDERTSAVYAAPKTMKIT